MGFSRGLCLLLVCGCLLRDKTIYKYESPKLFSSLAWWHMEKRELLSLSAD